VVNQQVMSNYPFLDMEAILWPVNQFELMNGLDNLTHQASAGHQITPQRGSQDDSRRSSNSPHPRHQCPWATGCTESFKRLSDLRRHWQAVHLRIRYHCFAIGCKNNRGNGYCRFEKLKTHQREKHGWLL
jgi:hypothetical protein